MRLFRHARGSSLLLALGLIGFPIGDALADSPAEQPPSPDSELIASSFESDAASWVRNFYRPGQPIVSDQFSAEPKPGLGLSIPLSDSSSLRFGAETENLDVGQPGALDIDTWHFGYRFSWD